MYNFPSLQTPSSINITFSHITVRTFLDFSSIIEIHDLSLVKIPDFSFPTSFPCVFHTNCKLCQSHKWEYSSFGPIYNVIWKRKHVHVFLPKKKCINPHSYNTTCRISLNQSHSWKCFKYEKIYNSNWERIHGKQYTSTIQWFNTNHMQSQTNFVFRETSSTLKVSKTNTQLKIFLKIQILQKLKLNTEYSIKASF